MQHPHQPVHTDITQVPPADSKRRLIQRPVVPIHLDFLPEVRRYLLLRWVVFGGLCLLLILHWIFPGPFDITTVLLIAGLYLLGVGSSGLEVARLSGGSDQRRQERLTEDALRRAGRLQSHLEPGTANDEVVTRILSTAREPRHAVILAGDEAEAALRAVYRHYAETERVAGTSPGTDLPLAFVVQELIWRALLAPDIFDTAEPLLALREMAQAPRAQISQQVASDAARVAQAVVLRVQSLGIEINPKRVPLAWMRPEPPAPPVQHNEELEPESAPPTEPPPPELPPEDDGQSSPLRFARSADVEPALEEPPISDDQLDGSVSDAPHRDTRSRHDGIGARPMTYTNADDIPVARPRPNIEPAERPFS